MTLFFALVQRWITRACIVAVSGLAAWGTAVAQQPFSTKAPHAVIMDEATGNILYAKDADIPIPPASMSKLMTVAVVLDLIEKGELTLDTPFMVSEKAWRTGGSKMFVLVDTEISVEDLLRGAMAVSGNDATIVLAENIAGSEAEFANLMNERAKAWGLKSSHFVNPTGEAGEGQVMSTLDLARLARLIWRRYPDYHYLFSINEFTWSKITQRNRNPLLATFAGADGMKTGYTDEAGYGLVGTAERDGARRFIVLAGMESEQERAREADRMMGLAFTEFAKRTFFNPGDLVGEAEVFGGRAPAVPLRIDVPITFTLHKRILDGAEAKIVYEGPLTAPLRANERVAVLQLSMPDHQTREYPLYTAEPVRGLSAMAKIKLGLEILFTPPSEIDQL
ncbi:D-alanyl-D-alanine carboxypeptidase family protein [Parvularcula sp. LCG005]|uniref:D-alanyl-D-alanine carboxypeptidase family protein n=1 Tax=Parvularcula sp. LCG005 TaxID=3078805 RepID=UPI002942157D|nr:D-alanyl-D-alanine carboxypeptidase family protein [Parvularcula sp. LCG005]WOI54794.1 D-alanyl-D-alanine carboxypeptidase family protein [Parvularcula sp. LCG005]